MQFIKQLLGVNLRANNQPQGVRPQPRLKVGILGTGKIGVDLLVKVMRSDWMECAVFSGRDLNSEGMRYAAGLGVALSDRGIDVFFDSRYKCDIVFDATTAASHLSHARVFEKLGIFAVDMTPSHIGECCVPALGMPDVRQSRNISMISCGGQSSIPIAHTLYHSIPDVRKIEVKSIVSANSIGPGTLANIKEYYSNTQAGLRKYTGDIEFSVDLIVDAVNLHTPMLTSVTAYCDLADLRPLKEPLLAIFERVQNYVPGYRLVDDPVRVDGGVRVDLCVEGLGDYLPKYAGNLDIINCAAIAVAEDYARTTIRAKMLSQTYNLDADYTEPRISVAN
jgi:acetaldehyde dehydrogenase (acetylating)